MGMGLIAGLVLLGEEVKWGRIEWDPSKPKPVPTGPALEVTLTIFERIAKNAKEALVWEGLPHPFEKELLETEQKRTETVRLHGDLFYQPGQRVNAEQAEKFRVALAAAALPFGGSKLCGGFHADYAVAWENDNGSSIARVCFGCGEIKFNTPQGETIADLSGEGRKVLGALFEPFKKERPPSQFSKQTKQTK